MRFIPTRTHGVVDYIAGIILIASPWLFGFSDVGTAAAIPIIIGVAAITYSLCTHYEYGLFGLIPMPVHLWLDGISGAFLAISPWLFGFAEYVFVPHLVFGLFEIAAALCTQPRSHVEPRPV